MMRTKHVTSKPRHVMIETQHGTINPRHIMTKTSPNNDKTTRWSHNDKTTPHNNVATVHYDKTPKH